MTANVAGEVDDTLALIRSSADAVGDRADLSRVRSQRFSGPGFDIDIWKQMASLGWIGVLVPESSGGLGLGLDALVVLAEEMGARLAPEPLVETSVVASLLEEGLAREVVAGTALALPAWQSGPNQLFPDDRATICDGRANGVRRFVYGGSAADVFLLLTQSGAAIVDRNAPGLSVSSEPTQDGGCFATLRFEAVPARSVDLPADTLAAAFDAATLATAAYLLGLMDRAFQLTLDYLRTRQQFGKAIGSFQALQHKAADLFLQIELVRASIRHAVKVAASRPSEAVRQAAVSCAKARAADAAILVTRQAIQLHGGIGFADECDIGLFVRRAMVVANAYGSAMLHRSRYARVATVAEKL